jgi:glucokinase
MAAKAVMQGVTTLIREMVNGDLNAINPDVVRRAAESGDALAQDILERAGFYLGTGMANVLTILSPHCVVIGGGVTALGEWIMRPIRETLAQRCHTVPLEQVVFSSPALGEAAGMLGAALWAQAQDANR